MNPRIAIHCSHVKHYGPDTIVNVPHLHTLRRGVRLDCAHEYSTWKERFFVLFCFVFVFVFFFCYVMFCLFCFCLFCFVLFFIPIVQDNVPITC